MFLIIMENKRLDTFFHNVATPICRGQGRVSCHINTRFVQADGAKQVNTFTDMGYYRIILFEKK